VPGRPYTERLFGGTVDLERTVVSVPGGRRWVVRDVVGWHTEVARVYVAGAAGTMLAHFLLAGDTTEWYGHWTGRQALYAGEPLSVWSYPAGAVVAVTGYSFDDS
jgi:hypothetical protein